MVAAAVGILVAADVGPFADETEEDRVRETVERFVDARDGGDFSAVCRMLTPMLKRAVQATSGAEPGTRPPACARVLEAQGGSGSGEEDASVEIVDASVSGNRARVAVERQEGVSQSIDLELIEGEWRIATLEG